MEVKRNVMQFPGWEGIFIISIWNLFWLMDVDQEEKKNQCSLACIQSEFHSKQGQKGERCKEKNFIYVYINSNMLLLLFKDLTH